MKKLLSCLIVLSMMFSLFAFVPAVSAAETTEEVENEPTYNNVSNYR